MCLPPPPEHIAETIRKRGHWPDCEWLTRLWRLSTKASSCDLFVDVGAHIGACSLEMLLSTNATIVAIEPNPTNLFFLTSTLAMAVRAEPSIAQRVVVLPVGAGASSRSARITLRGGQSAVVDTNEAYSANVAIRRLDDLIRPRVPIRLLKAGVQGLECEVLRGASDSLASTVAAALEVDNKLLRKNRCDPASVVRLLAGRGLAASLTPTMSETTAFAHRWGPPCCTKHAKEGVHCSIGNGSCPSAPIA